MLKNKNIIFLLTFSFFTLYLFSLLLPGCIKKKTDSQPSKLKTNISAKELAFTLENEIPKIMKNALIPGLSIAVIRDGEIFWSKAFGVKNMDNEAPVTDSTIFEAASLSKPLYAYAVMKLVKKGVIDLDKPLIEYVDQSYIEKNFLGRKIDDDRFRKITARMVLTHSSGFPNWRRQNDLTINFEPGEKFSYSGEGFGYLQKIIEKLTGKPLNDFMNEMVFSPLGMTNSSYVWLDKFDSSTAIPHGYRNKPLKKRKPKIGHAAATLHTTARDYAKYILAVMNFDGLTELLVDSMLTPRKIVDPEDTHDVTWGLGVGLQNTPHGISYWHWGDNMNFRCFFLALPEQKMGLVYFTNSFYGLKVRKQFVDLALGGTHPALTSNILNGYDNN